MIYARRYLHPVNLPSVEFPEFDRDPIMRLVGLDDPEIAPVRADVGRTGDGYVADSLARRVDSHCISTDDQPSLSRRFEKIRSFMCAVSEWLPSEAVRSIAKRQSQ